MRHYLSIQIVLFSFATGGTLRAATRPHAGPASLKANLIWTNADLNRLGKVPGLISVAGVPANQASKAVAAPAPPSKADDPTSYAKQAACLKARLEAEQTDLRAFTHALDDVRELKNTDGVNLGEDDIGITPEATIEILQNSIRETQRELDALEDLARRNDIPPGALRGQWPGVPPAGSGGRG